MSIVTDIILLFNLEEDEALFLDGEDAASSDFQPVVPCVVNINDWLKDSGQGELEYVSSSTRGGKAFQALVYIGSFGYLDIDRFIEIVQEQTWKEPQSLSLLIKREGEISFSMYVFGGSELYKAW